LRSIAVLDGIPEALVMGLHSCQAAATSACYPASFLPTSPGPRRVGMRLAVARRRYIFTEPQPDITAVRRSSNSRRFTLVSETGHPQIFSDDRCSVVPFNWHGRRFRKDAAGQPFISNLVVSFLAAFCRFASRQE
jgi:hypothetical protein